MSSGNVRISIELLDRLEADQRRLEWLMTCCSSIYGSQVLIHRYLDYMDDWREAIDEAMQEDGR